MVDHLGADAAIADLLRRIRVLETANPLEAASIAGAGSRLRVGDGATLLVEGLATVDGVLAVTGHAEISGTLELSGNGTVTGHLSVGAMTFDTGGPYGGRISASTLLLDAGQTVVDGNLTVAGSESVAGSLGVDDGMTVSGVLTNSGMTDVAPSGHAPNVWVSPSGRLYRVV